MAERIWIKFGVEVAYILNIPEKIPVPAGYTYSINTSASFSYSRSVLFISASISSGVRVTPAGGGEGARNCTWYFIGFSALGSSTVDKRAVL